MSARAGINWNDAPWEPVSGGSHVFVADRLAAPLRQSKSHRIFVNSDLFHEKLTNEQIAAVFGVMAAAPQHTFQCLTKRPGRMREWFAWAGDEIARSDWMRAPRRPDAAPAVHKVMEWLGVHVPRERVECVAAAQRMAGRQRRERDRELFHEAVQQLRGISSRAWSKV